jgi:magnesium-transporting ATPase (P-type)
MNEVKELLSIPLEELYKKLETSENGLSEEEAKRRLEIYGFNEVKKKRITFFQMLLLHIFNPIILLLLFASILSFFLGEKIDAMIILTIIGISLALDLIQEHKAKLIPIIVRIIIASIRHSNKGREKKRSQSKRARSW